MHDQRDLTFHLSVGKLRNNVGHSAAQELFMNLTHFAGEHQRTIAE